MSRDGEAVDSVVEGLRVIAQRRGFKIQQGDVLAIENAINVLLATPSPSGTGARAVASKLIHIAELYERQDALPKMRAYAATLPQPEPASLTRRTVMGWATEIVQVGEMLKSTNKLRGDQLISLGLRIASRAPSADEEKEVPRPDLYYSDGGQREWPDGTDNEAGG